MIETLDNARRDEAATLIAEAFKTHPHMPPDPTGRRRKLMIDNLFNSAADAPDANIFGISHEGRLQCAAFVFDASYELRGFALLMFLIRMVRALGWKMSRAFTQVMAEKPKRDERQLELMLLGTSSDCQQQGLGRQMIRHILEFARQQGYQSVVLEVAKETPAHNFYLSEGFVLEKEVELPFMPLCLLRCPVAE